MRKWCTRLAMICYIFGFALLAICQYTELGDRILKDRENSVLIKTLLPPFVLLCVLSLFGGWGLMLYDWDKRKFKSTSYRQLWFFSMIVGMMVGALIYYVIVFEMGMTVKQDDGWGKAH